MPRITPLPVDESGNAVTNSVLARTMGRRPEILKAFARLDAATRFHGLLPPSLKEALRRATAGEVGCAYCASLDTGEAPAAADRRESLAVAFAQLIAQDPAGITDAQFDVLREEFTEDEIVELVAFVCLVGVAGQMFGAVMGLEAADPDEAAAYQAVISGRG
ncbi:carboxymuconolactone decarboxylase family protein [Pseudonocardia sp. RS11V-5]|uniref:carboxymuconolactone decarboxylase family protein n=1 Tax=Pseudonocardia terrae TaxID=2905831 RepID=UPI001E435F32|nr:carboxymuconolactone decarboxylase family protein [Pseudonocardia terrae]MCE3550446.1 carboxymuconolactone decarboxylase family protein [Pseudonocardia terrae]